MLRFWLRELGGWLLVLGGLYVFAVCMAILLAPAPSIFEASILSVVGIFVFRGGIHLLKVAVAARVCMAAQEERRKNADKRDRVAATPYDW